MDGLLLMEFRFVSTAGRSFNVFVEESYEGWHRGVFVLVISTVWGRQTYTSRWPFEIAMQGVL